MKTIILAALLSAVATIASAQTPQVTEMRNRAELARQRSQQHAENVRQRAYLHQQEERARQAELRARYHNY